MWKRAAEVAPLVPSACAAAAGRPFLPFLLLCDNDATDLIELKEYLGPGQLQRVQKAESGLAVAVAEQILTTLWK